MCDRSDKKSLRYWTIFVHLFLAWISVSQELILVLCWKTGFHHRWELLVLHYHEIMVIYPYPFLVRITLFFSCIIFIHYCICILNGSPV